MKLIMESWRAYKGKIVKEEAEGDSPEQIAMAKAVKHIKNNYSEEQIHKTMSWEEVEDMVMNTYADNHPEEGYPEEEEIIAIYRALGITHPDESYDDDLSPDDYNDPPGYMPGEGRNW
tara:strand:+ start:501 stop:854 length:354 start_codon:yes stop_codon:yes gene_type:complete